MRATYRKTLWVLFLCGCGIAGGLYWGLGAPLAPAKEGSSDAASKEPSKGASAGSAQADELSRGSGVVASSDLSPQEIDAAMEARDRSLHAAIQSIPYTAITADNLNALVAEIPQENADTVPEELTKALLSLMEHDIWAYKTADPDLILETRLRGNFVLREEGLKHLSYHPDRLKHWKPPLEIPIPSDPEGIVRASVQVYYGGIGEATRGFADFYNELASSGSKIVYQQSSELPVSLQKQVGFDEPTSAGSLAFVTSPAVEYVNSPLRVLERQGTITYVDVYLAASDWDGDKFVRYKRFYWSPEDKMWLGWEVGRSSAARGKPVKMEFF